MQSSLADFIARQATLVTKKRAVVPVVTHYWQVTDSLERTLDRLGLDRKAAPIEDVDAYLAREAREKDEQPTPE